MSNNSLGKPWIAGVALVLALGLCGANMAMAADREQKAAGNEPARILPAFGPKEAGMESQGDEIPAWRARWELARLLSYTKRYDESLQQYRKLLAEKPGHSQARTEMAKVLFWAGHKSEALKELEQLPGGQASPETKLLKADLMAADKRYPEAIELYRQYLKDKPDDLGARFRLAQVLSWSGQYPPALKEYEIILSQKPDDMQVRRHYAFVLSWAGQFEKAAKELKKTLND
jgi:tetratricopeptide (TPR) repeat protein